VNRRASASHLIAWKTTDNKKRREDIIKSADAIIAAWRDSKEAFKFEEGSETREHFDIMEQLWSEV
jgi:hypothetical protein